MRYTEAKRIIVGRDVRKSSDLLFKSFSDGIIDGGGDVISIGRVSTPLLSFSVGKFHIPGAMITASHNPPEYNGFKLIDKNVLPIGYDFGLKIIADYTDELHITKHKGRLEKTDITREYIDFLLSKMENKMRRLKITIDYSNGMAGDIFEMLLSEKGITHKSINRTPDGNFPGHDPNPLHFENLKALQELAKNSDIGICFDGDGDRAVFLDESGEIISPDLITGVIAQGLEIKNQVVLCDVRTSKGVLEFIEKSGGKPERVRVGHAYARRKMREANAILGGELAGHYYFRDMFYADSGILAAIFVMNAMIKNNKPLSALVKPLKKYYSTGELNFKVEEKDKIINLVADKFSDGKKSKLDGLTIEFRDWWFNLRKSNTEPYLRLIIEADTSEILEEKRDFLTGLIKDG